MTLVVSARGVVFVGSADSSFPARACGFYECRESLGGPSSNALKYDQLGGDVVLTASAGLVTVSGCSGTIARDVVSIRHVKSLFLDGCVVWPNSTEVWSLLDGTPESIFAQHLVEIVSWDGGSRLCCLLPSLLGSTATSSVRKIAECALIATTALLPESAVRDFVAKLCDAGQFQEQSGFPEDVFAALARLLRRPVLSLCLAEGGYPSTGGHSGWYLSEVADYVFHPVVVGSAVMANGTTFFAVVSSSDTLSLRLPPGLPIRLGHKRVSSPSHDRKYDGVWLRKSWPSLFLEAGVSKAQKKAHHLRVTNLIPLHFKLARSLIDKTRVAVRHVASSLQSAMEQGAVACAEALGCVSRSARDFVMPVEVLQERMMDQAAPVTSHVLRMSMGETAAATRMREQLCRQFRARVSDKLSALSPAFLLLMLHFIRSTGVFAFQRLCHDTLYHIWHDIHRMQRHCDGHCHCASN
jgi:hypothetical protein